MRDRDRCASGADKNTAWAKNNFAACAVTGSGEGIAFEAAPNTNIMYNKTVIPAIKYKLNKGETIIETIITEE